MSSRHDRSVVRVTAHRVPCAFQDVSPNTVPPAIPAVRRFVPFYAQTDGGLAASVHRPSALVDTSCCGRENDWKERKLKKKKYNSQRKREIAQQYIVISVGRPRVIIIVSEEPQETGAAIGGRRTLCTSARGYTNKKQCTYGEWHVIFFPFANITAIIDFNWFSWKSAGRRQHVTVHGTITVYREADGYISVHIGVRPYRRRRRPKSSVSITD